MTWTRFMDMHSGGGSKEDFEYLLIEAPQSEAIAVFYARFGHSPNRVTCTCCGEDYAIDESETIEAATAYDRGLRSAQDDRGWHAHKEDDYRETRYLEPGEEVPHGMELGQSYSWHKHGTEGQTMDEFLATRIGDDYAIIYAKDIKPKERRGTVPSQGYVWVD